jgi:hypothetical protein
MAISAAQRPSPDSTSTPWRNRDRPRTLTTNSGIPHRSWEWSIRTKCLRGNSVSGTEPVSRSRPLHVFFFRVIRKPSTSTSSSRKAGGALSSSRSPFNGMIFGDPLPRDGSSRATSAAPGDCVGARCDRWRMGSWRDRSNADPPVRKPVAAAAGRSDRAARPVRVRFSIRILCSR